MSSPLAQYLSFFVGESECAVSGVLSCVGAALVLADKAWPLVDSREALEIVWHAIEYFGNTVLFFLAGVITGRSMVDYDDKGETAQVPFYARWAAKKKKCRPKISSCKSPPCLCPNEQRLRLRAALLPRHDCDPGFGASRVVSPSRQTRPRNQPQGFCLHGLGRAARRRWARSRAARASVGWGQACGKRIAGVVTSPLPIRELSETNNAWMPPLAVYGSWAGVLHSYLSRHHIGTSPRVLGNAWHARSQAQTYQEGNSPPSDYMQYWDWDSLLFRYLDTLTSSRVFVFGSSPWERLNGQVEARIKEHTIKEYQKACLRHGFDADDAVACISSLKSLEVGLSS